jgi:hypothetical protein
MREEQTLAEIEDFIEGFNQPTFRGMRINGVRVGAWSSQTGVVWGRPARCGVATITSPQVSACATVRKVRYYIASIRPFWGAVLRRSKAFRRCPAPEGRDGPG